MNLALPLLHIINANFIAHTIDNIRLNTLFLNNSIADILQHSPLLKGYALTFPTCTPLSYLIIFIALECLLEILNFVGSLTNKTEFVDMIDWLGGGRLGRKLGGEVWRSLMCIPHFPLKKYQYVKKIRINGKKEMFTIAFLRLKKLNHGRTDWLTDNCIYFLCGHTVYIYIDTLVKFGYICIYVSSNFILCASLLIPKTKQNNNYLWLFEENGYFLTNQNWTEV